jgi:hypothetical protein
VFLDFLKRNPDLVDPNSPQTSGKLQFCFFCLKTQEKRELAEKSTASTDRKAGPVFKKTDQAQIKYKKRKNQRAVFLMNPSGPLSISCICFNPPDAPP